MKNGIPEQLRETVCYFIKWTLISAAAGVLIGAVGAIFGHGVILATRLWNACRWTVFLAPAAGVFIVWLYHIAHEEKNRGTDAVLDAVTGRPELSPVIAPLMFAATILSHAVSISTGREGAALQIGGSLGSLLGKLFRLDEGDRKTAILCGMSACFSALFGTPLAAGLFPLEIANVGSLSYAALVPCFFASFLGAETAGFLGLAGEHYDLGAFTPFTINSAGMALLIAAAGAFAGFLLCTCLHKSHALYAKGFPNPYFRILAASAFYIVLTLAFPERLYNGGGLHLIERCFAGEAVPCYAFLLKILFTAVALGAGFKGGEIVPALCVGATSGYALAGLCGFPAGLSAGIGMMCVFVSVTNCPLSTLFMSFELFGFEAMPYFALAVAVSFILSGSCSLYHSQCFASSRLHMLPYESRGGSPEAGGER